MDLVQLVSSLNAVLGELAINSGSSTLVQTLTDEVHTQANHLEKLVTKYLTATLHDCSKLTCYNIGEKDFHN